MTAQAAQITTPIGTMEKLKEALEASGDANITITGDIIVSVKLTELQNSGYTYIKVGSGNKKLDLAGHKVELNVTGGGEIEFVRVPTGASLTVRDSSVKQTGKLWADGDMESIPWSYNGNDYMNRDVRYRNTVVVDGGSFTLEGGEIEAGRAKEMYICEGMKIDMFDQQLNNALSGGVLYWAVACRFDGNAYQIVNGDAVTLKRGSVTINGGKVTGKGYRKLRTEFTTSRMDVELEFVRAAAVNALSGDLTINGGTIYGMANADALYIGSDVNTKITAGAFKTQLLKKILLPTFGEEGNGFRLYAFVAEYDRLSNSTSGGASALVSGYGNFGQGAGNLGFPVDILTNDHALTLDGAKLQRSDYDKRVLTNTSGSEGHTLTVTSKQADAVYTYSPAALQQETEIATAGVSGTMARNMTLRPDTLTFGSDGDKVKSVYTRWYRNGELISGEHTARFGTYVACTTLYAHRGYKFTENTKFLILKTAPAQTEIAADGSSVTLWSQPWTFECDHTYNEDTSIHYDGLTHYQVCSVCGEKLAEERHVMDGGSDFGPVTTFRCTTCGYSYDVENGKTKIAGLVIDFPVAVDGDPIPQPRLLDEFNDAAQLMTWDLRKDSTDEPYHMLKNFEAGETYTLICRARARDGYYFAPNARMNCAAAASGTNDGDDGALITTWKIHCYARANATAKLPDLYGGMPMGEYFAAVSADIDGTPSGNIQATIKKHGTEQEVYVRRTLTGGWQLVRGADSLESFFASTVEPDTAYDVSFDFSTDNHYIAADAVSCLSPASYAGHIVEGGETWFSVSATVISSGKKVTMIDLGGVGTPVTGGEPDSDYTMKTRSLLRAKTGKWDTTEPFAGEKEYTFTAEVELKEGSEFGSDVAASVNGDKADVKISGRTATVTYTFPATEPEIKQAPKDNPFTDVKESDSFYDAVIWAYYHEPQVTNGTSADKFSPTMICNRGQVVTFLWRVYGCPEPKTKTNPFTDVAESDWFCKPVLWAVEQGITNGTSATTFSPAQTCTYAHVLTFLYRAAGSPGAKNDPNRLWYSDALTWANEKGLLADTGLIHCEPTDNCPRQDIVQYLYRQLKDA